MSARPSSLTIDIRAGESFSLDDGRVVVEVLEKSGRTARLRVHAPRDMSIRKTGSDEEEECSSRRTMQCKT